MHLFFHKGGSLRSGKGGKTQNLLSSEEVKDCWKCGDLAALTLTAYHVPPEKLSSKVCSIRAQELQRREFLIYVMGKEE